jgi:hypothetical protein
MMRYLKHIDNGLFAWRRVLWAQVAFAGYPLGPVCVSAMLTPHYLTGKHIAIASRFLIWDGFNPVDVGGHVNLILPNINSSNLIHLVTSLYPSWALYIVRIQRGAYGRKPAKRPIPRATSAA